ncbi:DUF2225 domain-containing protein [[Bacillus] enclensis]|uniref:DUF2225 domain-containing protein n=1 Tax=[Bacillus] enclensis TaxID=1402860 RepID=UPI001FD50E1E|nr:DUF2225 domain-containing protein [[Bacillus] enclensis]
MTELTPYYDKKIQCLACRHSYSTTKIRSRFVKVKGHESDFCPVYGSDEINPLLYNVSVCPPDAASLLPMNSANISFRF